MIFEVVDFLVGLGRKIQRSEVVTIKDKDYNREENGALYPIEFYDKIEKKLFQTIETKTLTSIVDFLSYNFEKLKLDEGIYIHIIDYNEVKLKSNSVGDFKQKHTYLFAANNSHDPVHNAFNRFYQLEELLIVLNTNFIPGPDFEKLVNLMTRVVRDEKQIIDENGVFQTVTIKSGIDLNTKEKIPKIFTLKPYRTFMEIDQPESDFYFRIKKCNEGTLLYGLFNADADFWKNEAMQSIKTYLIENLAEIVDEIGADIPIIM